jgi:hypothetical protein
MHRIAAFLFSVLGLTFLSTPARADVTVTHFRDFGFFANWGNVTTPCPENPNLGKFIFASLNFAENSTLQDGTPAPLAVLNLAYSNDCADSDSGVPFSASGITDPAESPFPWNFNQHFQIDKNPVGGQLEFATYSASIPINVDSHGCFMLATVNVRLDKQGPPVFFHNLTRTNEDGTVTVDFFRMTSRVAIGSGTISVGPIPGDTCNVGTLPPNFAIFPQVTFPDGSPNTFIYRTANATLTRTTP